MSYNTIASHYHLPRMREMGRVYWCNTFAVMGSSLVVIFVPIFLLKIGYSFKSVLIFLLLQQVLAAITQYPISLLFKRWHSNHILALGALFYAVFFTLLGTWHSVHWSLFVLALLWALNRSTYWAAFHYNFSSARAHRKSTEQIAGVQSLAILAATAAPALGGLIATLFGINYSYWAAVVLLIAAALPLFAIRGEAPKTEVQLAWKQFLAMRRDALANACNGIVMMAELNLWPLLIFTIISSYFGIGTLSSVIAITTVIVTLYVGRHHKKQEGRQFIKSGLGAYSLTSIGRALAQSTPQIFGLNLLAGIGRSLYVTPFMNKYYTNSDGSHRLGYIVVMEIAFAIGSAVFVAMLLLLTLFLSAKAVLAVGLALVALFVLGVRLIR